MKKRTTSRQKKRIVRSTLLIPNKTNSGIYRSTPPTTPRKVRSRRISPSLVHGFGVATILIRNWHRYRYLTLGIMQSIKRGDTARKHGTRRVQKKENKTILLHPSSSLQFNLSIPSFLLVKRPRPKSKLRSRQGRIFVLISHSSLFFCGTHRTAR